MQRLRYVGTDVVLHAALLHDVVEDTSYVLSDLADMGYDQDIIVSRYTDGRDRERSYLDWIRWIAEQGNMAAVLVKYADLIDNNAPGRLATLPTDQSPPWRMFMPASVLRSDLVEQTIGVECRMDAGVIDEAPGSYKEIDTVMAHQHDLVEVVHTLKQFVCVNG